MIMSSENEMMEDEEKEDFFVFGPNDDPSKKKEKRPRAGTVGEGDNSGKESLGNLLINKEGLP